MLIKSEASFNADRPAKKHTQQKYVIWQTSEIPK